MSNKDSRSSTESRVNLTVTVRPGIKEAALEMAGAQNNSVSRWIEILIMREAESHPLYRDKPLPWKP